MKKSTLFFMILMVVSMTLSACDGSTGNNTKAVGISKNIDDDTKPISSEETEEAYDKDEIDDTGYEESYTKDDTWAIYWYLCGSDLESRGGAATADLLEMMDVYLPKNIKVIIETGGTTGWQNDLVDPSVLQRYVYSGDEIELVDEQPQGNMGDSSTIQDFLNFCTEEYPADHKMLLVWDHGGGSLGGVAYDENYDFDCLTLQEMNEVLYNVRDNDISEWLDENQPTKEELNGLDAETFAQINMPNMFEVIGFDACLMATLNTAQTFGSPYASYLVASQETEPGNGWNYTGWLGALADNPGMNGAQLGKAICDSYMEGCEQYGTADRATLSVMDLNQIFEVGYAFDEVGKEILSSAILYRNVGCQFARCAESSENFGGNNNEEGYTDMVDLGDLVGNAQELLPETSDQLLTALEDVVVYKVNGPYCENATGLSAFYPYNGSPDAVEKYDNNMISSITYGYFTRYLIGEEISEEASSFLEFLDEMDIAFDDVAPIQPFNDDMSVEITEDNYARLNLDPESLDSVKNVFFDLAYYSEEDDIILFLGMDNDLTTDWDSGIFEDNFRGVWGALDGNFCYMEITYEGDDYNLYSVPIYLKGEECVMRVAYNFDTEDFEILGVKKKINEENMMADKNLIKLKVGDEVIPILYAMSLSGEDEDVTEVPGDPITLEEGFSFDEEDLGDGTFAYAFEVVDLSNNEFQSDVVLFEYTDGEINYLTE